MDKHPIGIMRLVCALSIFVLLFSFSGTSPAQAQTPDPACPDGACPANSDGSEVTSQTSAALKLYTKVTLHGGYRASGVGMRNLGYGSLQAPVLPPKSTVYKAYLPGGRQSLSEQQRGWDLCLDRVCQRENRRKRSLG